MLSEKNISHWLCLMLLLIAACKSDLKHGQESLEGRWVVSKIISTYGEKLELGTTISETVEEEGVLGTFTFSEEELDYSYTRRDTLYNKQANWSLSENKVQEGFFKVPEYTLTIEEEDWIVDFEDGTSDATRKARAVVLSRATTSVGPYQNIQLFLSKE